MRTKNSSTIANITKSCCKNFGERTGGKPALSLGCDFNFSYENVQEAQTNAGKFCIGNTPYLLVEFNDYSLPPAIDENLARLINIGLKPIITHPERNPMLQRTPERVLDWVRGGCAVQITANSMTGRWGTQSRCDSPLAVRKAGGSFPGERCPWCHFPATDFVRGKKGGD